MIGTVNTFSARAFTTFEGNTGPVILQSGEGLAEKVFTVPIICITNNCRVRKNTLHFTCTS